MSDLFILTLGFMLFIALALIIGLSFKKESDINYGCGLDNCCKTLDEKNCKNKKSK